MQIVVLTGGLGARLRPLTDRTPKSLIPANGRPFLGCELEVFKQNGIRDVVLCVGHLGGQIRECFGVGSRPDLNIGRIR